jgi:hypothetical protein
MINKKFKQALVPCIIISFLSINFSFSSGRHFHLTAAERNMVSSELDETARFLAGKPVSETSKLYKYTRSTFYKRYIKRLNQGWNNFQKPNLNKIAEWWKKYSPSKYNKKILYPFSGPDIMNALTLFPDGELYLMFGLEQPGVVPRPHEMTNRQITAGLNGMLHSLQTIFRYNFFRTRGMEKNLGNMSFNSIAGLLMMFLSLNDYTIVDAGNIAIDAESRLAKGIKSDNGIKWQSPPKSRRIPGIEISFKKGNGRVKKIRFFMLNVIDYALTEFSPNFIPYIQNAGPYTTVIKSASYLMHNDKIKFTKIRKAVLAVSQYIVQDDSGVPLRYLTKEKWKVKFHGFYNTPIPMFRNRLQKDLKKAMKKNSTGTLPFSYGYNYKRGESNLMTIERIKK